MAAAEQQPQLAAAEGTPPKTCRACAQAKPRHEFHRNHSKADELEDVRFRSLCPLGNSP
jgi:hypothetical protein